MEHKGSLPCSQEPSTGPYPEPDQSSSYHSKIIWDPFEYYPRTYAFALLVISFLLAFPPISYMHNDKFNTV
jgi:hypothetical protein